jgi:hypothetical protein
VKCAENGLMNFDIIACKGVTGRRKDRGLRTKCRIRQAENLLQAVTRRLYEASAREGMVS